MRHNESTCWSLGVFLVATQRLYMSVCPSVRPFFRWLVTLSFFGLLGATNAVYTAPLLVSVLAAFPGLLASANNGSRHGRIQDTRAPQLTISAGLLLSIVYFLKFSQSLI